MGYSLVQIKKEFQIFCELWNVPQISSKSLLSFLNAKEDLFKKINQKWVFKPIII